VHVFLASQEIGASKSVVQDSALSWFVLRGVQDGAGGYDFAGNAFPIDPVPQNIAYLKKAIEKEMKLTIAAPLIDIYSQQDGQWKKEEKLDASLRDADYENPYGYTVA
ncbi:unnamed protein product, partial [Durusdinium trenchii]